MRTYAAAYAASRQVVAGSHRRPFKKIPSSPPLTPLRPNTPLPPPSPLPSPLSEITEFTDTVHTVIENLSAQAEVIEREKLKAVGQRNLVDSERDLRRRKVREVQALIAERLAELARLEAEHASLAAVEAGQRQVLEGLQNSEAQL